MKKSIILKVLLLATAMLLISAPISVFADEPATLPSHTDHIDTTGDGACDIEGCDEKLPCENHVDVNNDGFCDIEGCDECIEHSDDDKNDICDKCAACIKHIDEDKNKVCDRDGCLACIKHVDSDKDKTCDNCKALTSSNTFGTPDWSKNVFESLKMMGVGMVGIFLVIGLIITVIYVLNHFINMQKKETNED